MTCFSFQCLVWVQKPCIVLRQNSFVFFPETFSICVPANNCHEVIIEAMGCCVYVVLHGAQPDSVEIISEDVSKILHKIVIKPIC